MLYYPTRGHPVNILNVRGLAQRHLPHSEMVSLAADARLGLTQLTNLRNRDVRGIFSVSAKELAAEIQARVVAGGVQRLAAITAEVFAEKANGGSNGSGCNGHSDRAVEFAETLKAMDPNELAAAFKVAGQETIWGALVRAL
jgi:hypothetical protein